MLTLVNRFVHGRGPMAVLSLTGHCFLKLFSYIQDIGLQGAWFYCDSQVAIISLFLLHDGAMILSCVVFLANLFIPACA